MKTDCLICLFFLCAGMRAADSGHEFTILRTGHGNRFGVVGKKPARPAPTVFAMAQSVERTLTDKDFAHVGWLLAEQGFVMVALDVPCHGEDSRPDEPPRLDGWSFRTRRGEPLVEPFLSRASDVLDWLVGNGYTDRAKVAVYGISRGGFMALHFAAADARVRCAAGLAPVTDVGQLSEFRGLENEPLVSASSLQGVAEKLAARSLWITIGAQDQRVGTDAAIQLNRKIAQAAARSGRIPDMTMIIGPWEGHSVDAAMDTEAARWINAHCGAR